MNPARANAIENIFTTLDTKGIDKISQVDLSNFNFNLVTKFDASEIK